MHIKRNIITTKDGSTTIRIEGWDEQYHSKHGAIEEAYHVFIKNGLSLFEGPTIAILEMGFGTGLNALITLLEATQRSLEITYTGIEAYPITHKELLQLNFINMLNAKDFEKKFLDMHLGCWDSKLEISENFHLYKKQLDFIAISDEDKYDLIYFDAFGARVQPELWTAEIFSKMFKALKLNGVLVTYAAKGSVRRAMQEVGFTVNRLPGPPGKREMLRARKMRPVL